MLGKLCRMRLKRGLFNLRRRLDDIEFSSKLDEGRRRRIMALRLYRSMTRRGICMENHEGNLLLAVRANLGRNVHLSFTEYYQLAEVEPELLELLQG